MRVLSFSPKLSVIPMEGIPSGTVEGFYLKLVGIRNSLSQSPLTKELDTDPQAYQVCTVGASITLSIKP